ncbi:MAG: YqgE/AlgH family protein [Actinobacteria bacterium]|nr:YqgE/AlgH family protein [Actinomycetota bacterium]
MRDDREVISASLKGRLLIASPALTDPNFDRTIVLMLEHTDDGALGLVLNRPSDTALSELLPSWGLDAVEPSVVFLGGPVSPDSAIGLAFTGDGAEAAAPDGWIPLLGSLGTVDLARDPTEVRPSVRALRVFAGYAGWSGGQLEHELQAGGWFVADSELDDALTREPEMLWRQVLRRQRGSLSWLANFPADPASN